MNELEQSLLTSAQNELANRRAKLSSTYRLQLHKGFTFEQATSVVDYLAALGISHAYASPYLTAAAGSKHGYDVTGHDK
ncbi:MAG TPA: hypothetical protein VGB55_10630, partial [Tepidisphaeraceae bacterium]